MKLYDRVVTVKDSLGWGGVKIPKGSHGAIVEVYEDPEGFTVDLDMNELLDCKPDVLVLE